MKVASSMASRERRTHRTGNAGKDDLESDFVGGVELRFWAQCRARVHWRARQVVDMRPGRARASHVRCLRGKGGRETRERRLGAGAKVEPKVGEQRAKASLIGGVGI
jgi:hypothetical protein